MSTVQLLELLLVPMPAFVLACICAERSILPEACSPGAHPIVVVNLIFFLTVSVTFYALSLIEGSTWVGIVPLMPGHVMPSIRCFHSPKSESVSS